MWEIFQIWDHFLPLVFPKDSENLKSLDIGLQEVEAKRHINGMNKLKKSVKNFFCHCDFLPFLSKSFHLWDHFFLLLFPRGVKKSKKFGHWTSRNAGKKTVKRSEKHWYQKVLLSKAKFAPEQYFFWAAILHPLLVKVFKSEITSFHYFSSRILNL